MYLTNLKLQAGPGLTLHSKRNSRVVTMTRQVTNATENSSDRNTGAQATKVQNTCLAPQVTEKSVRQVHKFFFTDLEATRPIRLIRVILDSITWRLVSLIQDR